jgi:hypothetical protein
MTGFQDKQPPVISAAWANLVDASKNLFTDVGTPNAVNIQSGIPGGLPLSTDAILHVLIQNTNTSQNVNLTIDTNPQVPVVNSDGSFVAIAQLKLGSIVGFQFDGTRFQVISVTDALFGDGTVTNPSIAFSNAPGTGFYRAGIDAIGLSTAAQSRWTVDANGNFIFNSPTGGGTQTGFVINSANVLGQTGFQIVANSNFLNALGALDNLNDGPLALTEFALGCGTGPATKSPIGMIASNKNFSGTPFGGTSGPIAGFGMFQNLAWNFGLFVGSEMRLLFPGPLGTGMFAYGPNAGAFLDVNYDRGSFTGTLSGMGSTTTGPINWIKRGSEIEIFLTVGLQGTSTGGAMVLSGLPAIITPANIGGANNQNVMFFGVIDNTSPQVGIASPQTNGTIVFTLIHATGAVLSTASFTGSGTKGLSAGTSFKYKTSITQ